MLLDDFTATLPDIETLTSVADLDALLPEWHALWARCPAATPFQSPAWLRPWWTHFTGHRLLAFTLRVEGRLVGFAPFYIDAPSSGGRTVRLLGAGVSDYLDVLLEPEFALAGATAIFDRLDQLREEWDQCDFFALRPGSPLLSPAVPLRWSDNLFEEDASPVLSWPAGCTPDDVFPSSWRRKLRYDERRLARTCRVDYACADRDSFDEAFAALLRLHAQRWAARDSVGVLADDTVRAFHADAARQLLAAGLLQLHTLRADGRIVACCYGFLHRECAYYYLGGFDPACERLGVGNLIVLHAMRAAQHAGATSFDFLRGREPYKYRWGAKDALTYRHLLRHTRPDAG